MRRQHADGELSVFARHPKSKRLQAKQRMRDHSPSIKKGRLSYLCYGHRSFVADNRTRPRVRRIRIPHEETYLSDGWGENLRRKFRQRELREPWFAFLHLWELHKPRKVAQGFDSKRFGSDLYERAVSSLDPELERLLDLVGDDTIIILHGDHGKNREVVRQSLLFHFYHRLKRRFSYPVDLRFYQVWSRLSRL